MICLINELLNFQGAAYGFHYACELCQKAIANFLEDPALMRCYAWFDNVCKQCVHGRESALLIHAHEPAVAGYIGRHHGGKLTGDLGSIYLFPGISCD